MVFQDADLVPLLVQENYVNQVPNIAGGQIKLVSPGQPYSIYEWHVFRKLQPRSRGRLAYAVALGQRASRSDKTVHAHSAPKPPAPSACVSWPRPPTASAPATPSTAACAAPASGR